MKNSSEPTGGPEACRVVGVGHTYGRRMALSDINFTLAQGDIVGLVGANGSGKSTLLRILSGVQRPTEGTVVQFGEDLSASEENGRGIGAAVDGISLWPRWSIARNLAYVAKLAGAARSDVGRVLGLVDLHRDSKTRLRHLSLGNRQRVLLAAAILTGTRMTLLDEPMNGLDPQGRHRIRDLISTLAGQGRTVVLSSHDLHDVQSMCGTVIVLDEGQLAFSGPPSDYVGATRMSILQVARDAVARSQVSLTEAGIHCRLDSTGAPVVFAHDASAAGTVLSAAGVEVECIQERQATLEERFYEHS